MIIKSWERDRGTTANGHRVSFGGDEKVLEVDRDDSYTTVWMH